MTFPDEKKEEESQQDLVVFRDQTNPTEQKVQALLKSNKTRLERRSIFKAQVL